jgi:FkbM family methyltransferase
MEYFSQFDQDKLTSNEIFKDFEGGFFLDIGAHDGKTFNNTLHYKVYKHWTGINVEPIPSVFELLVKNRPTCININAAVDKKDGISTFLQCTGSTEMLSGLVNNFNDDHRERIRREISQVGGSTKIIKVPTMTVKSICEMYNVKHIHFLSLDVEGGEANVIYSIPFDTVFIDVICMECNYEDAAVPIINYLREKGYYIVTRKHDTILIHNNSQFLPNVNRTAFDDSIFENC